ncbi:uncharacterized protein LOC115386534 [Salarias fasciatus]|uniref:uncharacterized protein LOC115386534 n=1 Tax=Salarias fasciatus TaxID=181472 RepID=UPI001176BFE6|nr:linker for activation of T-cells family member 1 [Salarias fasciatus]XP_029944747.1 linker for activation of T-cells family member 1 [Salarias fasciatus]
MMDASWLPLLLSAAVLMAAVVLLAVCVDCRNNGPLASIPQTHASEDYIRSTDFRIIHPSRTNTDLNSLGSPSNLLSPLPNSVGGSQRQPSFTATETESNPSYENPGPECLDSDAEDPGYIIVLPDGEAPPSLSRASTPNSGTSDAEPNYVNIACLPPEDSQDYVNVEPSSVSQAMPESSAQTDDDDDDSDDDDEGNYVNQPPVALEDRRQAEKPKSQPDALLAAFAEQRKSK